MTRVEPILVTGASGFVGTAVTFLLRSRGLAVIAHARKSGPGIDWAADLSEPSDKLLSVPASIGSVIHCAAAIPARSGAFDRDNAGAATRLAAALCRSPSLRRIVHVSSVSVYKQPRAGRWMISEHAETVDATDPGTNSYARSKLATEQALDAVPLQRPGVTVSHLRASSIYGPGMVRTTLLPILVGQALRGEDLVLRGPRAYAQNFVHVADVAAITASLLAHAQAPHLVNAFSDDTYTLFALAELVRARLASTSRIVDGTDDTDVPAPSFVNAIAKQLHPGFRSLADHLRDAA